MKKSAKRQKTIMWMWLVIGYMRLRIQNRLSCGQNGCLATHWTRPCTIWNCTHFIDFLSENMREPFRKISHQLDVLIKPYILSRRRTIFCGVQICSLNCMCKIFLRFIHMCLWLLTRFDEHFDNHNRQFSSKKKIPANASHRARDMCVMCDTRVLCTLRAH